VRGRVVGVSAGPLAVSHGCWRLAGSGGSGLVAPRVVRLMLRAWVVVVGAGVVVGQGHRHGRHRGSGEHGSVGRTPAARIEGRREE
jgi:hypothetical protein